jgi:hypothetical protein
MPIKEERTAGQKIYDELVNNRSDDFWFEAHPEGVAVMKEVKSRLIKLGNGVFSGYPERGWSFLSNADQVDSLDRRIRRWESDLERQRVTSEQAA